MFFIKYIWKIAAILMNQKIESLFHHEVLEKWQQTQVPCILPERTFVKLRDNKSSINDACNSYHVTYLKFKVT